MAASTVVKVYPYLAGRSRVHVLFSLQENKEMEDQKNDLSIWLIGGNLSRTFRGQIELQFPTKEVIKDWNHNPESRIKFLEKFDNFERKAFLWKLEFSRSPQDALRSTEVSKVSLVDKERGIYYINYYKTTDRLINKGNSHNTVNNHRGLFFTLKNEKNEKNEKGELYYD